MAAAVAVVVVAAAAAEDAGSHTSAPAQLQQAGVATLVSTPVLFLASLNVAMVSRLLTSLDEMNPDTPTRPKLIARWIFALSMIAVGVSHFTDPDPFLTIMPPALPAHLELVYLSGAFEVLGGLGLLVARTRRFSAWGLVALLVAVYPANIHMLVNEVYLDGMPQERWLLWLRMPFQFVFIGLALWTGDIFPKERADLEEGDV